MVIHTDLCAIAHNIAQVRQLLGKAGLVFMVKADAYNHGMIQVAAHTEPLADKFGVAYAAEAAALRKAGIKKPIMVTAYCPAEAEAIISCDALPLINSIDGALALEKQAAIAQKTVLADVKIDSGMNRYGIKEESEIKELVRFFSCSEHVKIRALSTHFYSCLPQNVREQHNLFLKRAQPFLEVFGSLPLHMASSGTLERCPIFNYDEVRLGMILYGYGVGEAKLNLIPAMSISTEIDLVKTLKKGETTGYSAAFKAVKDTRIAIIRSGYFEGVDRRYSGGEVIVNGKKAKLIGNISMDSAIIDLGDIEAEAGDKVIIQNSELNADYWARLSGTINYEALTRFKGRYNRVFYE